MKLFIFLLLIICTFAQNSPYCGLGTTQPYKIVGGSAAAKGNWGWQVAMKYNGNFICGGSLINEQWIVTAAHCVYGRTNPSTYTFDAGINNRNIVEAWSKVNLKVSKVIVHPSYNPNLISNDIALMKLASPITFDTSYYRIVPVCVPLSSDWAQGKNGYSTGWGGTYLGGSPTIQLNQVSVPILTDEACRAYFGQFGYVVNTQTQVCAGYKNGGIGSCQGDSGGPLVVQADDGRWNLIGLASFGMGCGEGAYTRASEFLNWINTTIQKN